MRFRAACILLSTTIFAVAGCGGGSSNSTSLTTPTITWATPTSVAYGTALSAAQLDATASVPGTFTYSPAIGAVPTAGTQTLTVSFSPTDTSKYTTASATVTLTVTQVTPTLTWATPSAISYGTALSGAQLDATASIPGTFVYSPAAGTTPKAGSLPITVTFTPADATDYETATATVTLAVSQGTPTITWPTPSAISYGTALSSTQLDATANTPGTFVYSPAVGTTPKAGSQPLSVTFTPTDATDYLPATATVTLTVNQTTPVITWATPTSITYGTTLSATQLDATASVPGSFVYSPAAGATLKAGPQPLSVTFMPTDSTDYSSATESVTLTVNQATPVITWPTPAGVILGATLGSTQLDATANVPGTFVYTPASGTVLNTAGSIPLSTTFTPTDTADYTTATAGVTLAVNKAVLVVTWQTPAAITYGTALSATQLDATANVPGTFVYTPAAGTVLKAGSQQLSVTFTPTDTIDYSVTTSTTTLTVNQATPVITWATPAAVSQGATLGSAQLDAKANVPGAFVYTPALGTVVNVGGTTDLSAEFTPTDTVDYKTATAMVTLTVNTTVSGVVVDYGFQEQIIRGFGGSTAWLGQLTQAQANALFSQSSGLGLSILRMRIDPTGSATPSTKYPYPYETANWIQEATNAKEAKTANPNAIAFASPWTPPVSMKTNTIVPFTAGCSPAQGYCGGSLETASYADYAAYLEDFVTFFNATAGFDLYAISMQNEPDWNPTSDPYESCIWTPAQMDAWIASLTADGATNPLTAKLIMPESLNFSLAQAQTAMDDPNAEPNISILGGHLYGVSPTPDYFNLGQSSPGKQEVWMTEHATCEGGCPTPSVADALGSATEVHNSMTVGQFSAYVWWWIWNDPSDGVTYGLIDDSTSSPTPTYYGYGIGQFSDFVQPGYYRYDATAQPSSNVFVSAYAGVESGTQHYVIVAINAGSSAIAQSFTIDNADVTSMTPYQTTSAGGLMPQTAITVTGNAFAYTLPAQSITTFVQ